MQNILENQRTEPQRFSFLVLHKKLALVVFTLVLGAAGSIPLVFLTPPFQVPDEVQHFYRAYELSEFRIGAQVQNGQAGGTLPDSLPLLVRSSVYSADGIYYAAQPAPLGKTLSLASIPLDPLHAQFVAFPGSAFYSPLPYVPQLVGIAFGRIFRFPPLDLLYLGRLFNCLAALALLGLAVYVLPSGEELIILIGHLPMSQFLYASMSPDAAVIACALLFTALSLAAAARGRWLPWELAVAVATAAVFCSVKPVYAPLLLTGLVPSLFSSLRFRDTIRSYAILIAVPLGFTAAWMLFARSAMTTPLSGAHPSLQIRLVLHHPAVFLQALSHTLANGGIKTLSLETIGVFGWLTVPLHPKLIYLAPLAGFVVLCALGIRVTTHRSVARALCYFALAFASAILVMGALYFMWSRVGQPSIAGVQGRYFIPVLILFALAVVEVVPARRPSVRPWHSLAVVASVVVIQIIATDITIVRAFHVF